MHLGIHWTERSSPAVAATVITGCWTLALGIAAVVADLIGMPDIASRALGLAKMVACVTIAFGLLALLVSFDFGKKRARARIRASRDRAMESVR